MNPLRPIQKLLPGETGWDRFKLVYFPAAFLLYVFLINFLMVRDHPGILIEFPYILLIILPYLLLTLANPIAGVLIFLVYDLSGLKDMAPAYGSFLSPSILAEACILMALLLTIARTKRLPSFKDRRTMLLMLLVGLYILSSFLYGDPDSGGSGILKAFALKVLVYVFILYFMRSTRDLNSVFRAMVVISLIWFGVTVLAIAQFGIEPLATRTRVDEESRYYFGAIWDINTLSTVIIMFMPLVYHLIRHETKRIWKNLSILCFPLMTINVILLYSRNAFINLSLMMFLLFSRQIRSKKILAFGALFMVAVLLVPGSYWNRMSTITSMQVESGLRMKLGYYARALGIIAANPVFGAGYGNAFTVHNSVLQIGVDIGLGAVALFFWLLWTLYRRLRDLEARIVEQGLERYRLLPRYLIFSILAYLVGGLTISIPIFLPLFVVMALGVGLEQLERDGRLA